jgi:choline-glycine betaine transporter
MAELLAWLLFFGKLLLLMILVGLPLLLIIIFLANALYKLLSPKLEEWERKRDQSKK